MNRDSPKTTRIWLIRHGEPSPESRGRCYGRMNVGLSAEGKRQMLAVSSRLRDEPISAIYASPRSRTIESAEILQQDRSCPITIEGGFCEIDFGDFEGKPYEILLSPGSGIYRASDGQRVGSLPALPGYEGSTALTDGK